MFLAIHAAEMSGKDCVADTNVLTPGRRSEFPDWFPGFEHHLIFIEADEELRKKNNRFGQRVIPQEVLDQMQRELQPVSQFEADRRAGISYWINKNNRFELLWKCCPRSRRALP